MSFCKYIDNLKSKMQLLLYYYYHYSIIITIIVTYIIIIIAVHHVQFSLMNMFSEFYTRTLFVIEITICSSEEKTKKLTILLIQSSFRMNN